MGELFTTLERGLGSALSFFYDLIPSFGISIVLLTVAISIVVFPLTLRQTRSSRAFREVQPKIREIQKEHKNDKETMERELARVQKEAGATPGGCLLPMLVQLPIWFALYRVFRNVASIAHGDIDVTPLIPAHSNLLHAIQAGQTQFLGLELGRAMSDGIVAGLPGAIPYVLLLISMLAAQYAQQIYGRRANVTTASQQGIQRILTRAMPLFLGFISWNFPAGLVLYWSASNVARLGQQRMIMRMDGPATPPDESDVAGSVEATETDDQARVADAPSKKKQRRRR